MNWSQRENSSVARVTCYYCRYQSVRGCVQTPSAAQQSTTHPHPPFRLHTQQCCGRHCGRCTLVRGRTLQGASNHKKKTRLQHCLERQNASVTNPGGNSWWMLTYIGNADTWSCRGLTDGAATECTSQDIIRDVIEAAAAAVAAAACLGAVFFSILTEEYDGPKSIVLQSFELSSTPLSLRSCGTRSLTQLLSAPPSLSLSSSSSKNFFNIIPRVLR
jgi:hypothetical protein